MTTFNDVIDLIHGTKNKELLEYFLLALTTPYERKVLARRVELTKRLIAGHTQHQIADDFKIGVSTVARGAKELNRGRFKILRGSK